MPPAIAANLEPVRERWQSLPRAARAVLILGVVLAVLVAGAVYLVDSLLADYQVLFSNLSPEDAGAVVEALRVGKVSYRVADGGQLLVPASRVHEWRMRLANQGLPSGGHVGFEIFDKNQFGLTDFSQRLNYQRALQGELARTIGQLREVQQARVHLALPTPRVFASQDKPPSASVVLRLRAGAALKPEQVRGIVHLVTAAVEGLAPERVTVVDTTGRMLASGQERGQALSGNQVDARLGVEQEIERRVQSLLDPIVGAGHSAVRVSAVLDLDQVERTEERFDPKPLVKTQNKSREDSAGTTSQPVQVGAGEKSRVESSTATNKTARDLEQTTYEIARSVERRVVAPGTLRRLSVAVLLDVPTVNGQRTPRPDEEVQRIKRLVASAAGVRTDREDELEILQVPFDPGVAAPAEPPGAAPALEGRRGPRDLPTWVWAAAAGTVLLVLGAVVVLLLGRRRRRRAALAGAAAVALPGATRAVAPDAPALPDAPGLPPAPVKPLELNRNLSPEERLREQVAAAAREHPDEMAQIVRAWMFKKRASTTP